MNFQDFLSISPFSWSAIGTSLLCGAIIGLERQLRGKPVGIRTSSLIIMGTYLFVAASFVIANDASDPARVIGQVVTGIGFLGAGVMLAREGIVEGVTSAATIWTLAAVGVCISVGHEVIAVKISVVVVGILYGIDMLEKYCSILTLGVQSKYRNLIKKDRMKQVS